MPVPAHSSWRRVAATLAACAALPAAAVADRDVMSREVATTLRAKLTEIRPNLARNHFGRPLHLESTEGRGELKGDVYALLSHPYRKVRDGLVDAASWCEILTLPFNVKRCEARGPDAISMFIGRTPEAPVRSAVRIDFHYAVLARGDDVLRLELDAPSGPFGTKSYRIVLDATPVEDGRTFMHMSYGYGFGTVSRLAMQAYLATSGSSKMGFSREAGSDSPVRGMRGVLERNTMRYFLAIDAHLNTLDVPAGSRAYRRLVDWFDATERYPRQLHEMTREEYVALKQRDLADAATRVTAVR